MKKTKFETARFNCQYGYTDVLIPCSRLFVCLDSLATVCLSQVLLKEKNVANLI